MERENKLIKNTMIVAVGKICTQFISFFLLPLYTAVLTASEYGVVDLVNTFVSLLMPIIYLQIEQAVFRFLIDARENRDNTRKIICSTFIFVTILTFFLLFFYFFFAKYIVNEYKLYLVCLLIVSMFSNISLQITRGIDDNFTYSVGSLISGAGHVIMNVIFICYFNLGAIGMLLASIISNIMCFLYVFFKKRLWKYILSFSFDTAIIKKMLKYSIPLIPNQLSWWVVNASDRTLILYFIGVNANGIYSAANKFSAIVISIFNIFNLTWSESASLAIKDKDKAHFYSKVINQSMKFCYSLCFGIIAIMPFVFKYVITGESFSEAYFQIPILIISVIFNVVASLVGSIYIALKKSGEIAKTSFFAAIFNIAINLLLIKYIGLYAASFSTLVSYFTMAIYRLVDVQNYVQISLDFKFMSVSFVVLLEIVVIYYINSFLLSIIGLITVLLYSIIYNKHIIKSFFTAIINKVS
ncbi:MAG: oligosaccharide flippase family protein [Thomasclavelia ramosa]|uniref:oligosaccharide flippase family protein n=1 Tax=Amedibacterium intestinale TaxID=2583452 RepID=UPI00137456F6|nr:oligosaccharide flippase family protein [Amedibacterium intestinale]BBK63264.1 hypothetical protein A9CBEGH2_22040 [Amedibacterium intestinale]